ncbi:hypothetical protein [Deinococcus xianganensis]|uniref:Lipoprotein n=1 Tax=Deinococcus xianganensis TaxID=1507289 RepID=A0A6I4YJX0_9DEIO|nr:hypothetical protein [Deinococcus xianganensis]MXV21792.1 hypothetical protein [Deinococcus xianganensis]
MKALLLAMTMICTMTACTSAELAQLTPPEKSVPALPAPMVFKLSNPATREGSVPVCEQLGVTLTLVSANGQPVGGVGAEVVAGPGEAWARSLEATELEGVARVELRATCTSQDGAVAGYSVSRHDVTAKGQGAVEVTVPQAAQRLDRRVEWKSPVPTVLPLDN